jgi:naphtho-gamma-pyrone polyketide synthase
VTSRSGDILPISSFQGLIREALIDILQKPLCLDLLSEGLTKDLIRSNVSGCILLPVATLATQIFVAALTRGGVLDVTVDKSMERTTTSMKPNLASNGNIGESKLAIVGFSGRFPDAKDPEAFCSSCMRVVTLPARHR